MFDKIKRTLRPRSTLQLVGLGFILVSLPLIAAVITAIEQVDQLAKQNQRAVFRAEVATQESRALAEHLIAMERSLVQYQVLADRVFYTAYLARREEFIRAADGLLSLGLGEDLKRKIRQLVSDEALLFEQSRDRVEGPAPASDPAAVFSALSEKAQTIVERSSRLIDREAGNAGQAAFQLQRLLILQAAAVIPAALILAALSIFLVARPLKQIEQAIRRLGDEKFDDVIRVKGPSDLEELGDRLDWLRLRILRLERQKLAFLQHVSHELKTPLTTIREGSELLGGIREKDLGAEDAEIVEIMRESSLELQKLIEDLLQLGKSARYAHKANALSRIDLAELISKVLISHKLAIGAKQLGLQQQLAPLRIEGNAYRLRTVIDNLVSNAIKYAPVGSRIGVRLEADRAQVILDVEDAGPGIPAADRARVFDAFFQGDAVSSGPVKGTGLGLAIAKEYVEAHDGSIEIIDAPVGAHIRVLLPLVSAAAA
ncbi:MAG: HAMP domain-containing sensor histidine kinase [Thiohalocapsa sp.]